MWWLGGDELHRLVWQSHPYKTYTCNISTNMCVCNEIIPVQGKDSFQKQRCSLSSRPPNKISACLVGGTSTLSKISLPSVSNNIPRVTCLQPHTRHASTYPSRHTCLPTPKQPYTSTHKCVCSSDTLIPTIYTDYTTQINQYS